ncbi:MAG: PilW family protein [Rhodospirillaceae bacterium]|nr:PilW family protein [Rhodospirillaceae bacterium]
MTETCNGMRVDGLTLIELMVAMALGSFLLLGAMTVFTQGQAAFRVNESTARLQEHARLALAFLEDDLRMAGHFGLTTRPGDIANRASPVQPVPPGLAVRGDCGRNWAIDLDAPVAGTNNGFGWTGCAPSGQAQADADTLMIRRTSESPTPPDTMRRGTLYVRTARFGPGIIFDGVAPPPEPPAEPPLQSRSFQLLSRGYYVSQRSSLDTPGNPVPSLRMKTLAGSSSGPRIVDQEVVPGVEDLQVQFGVDTDRVGEFGRGSVNRYVNPGDPSLDRGDPAFLPEARVIAVRVWLRVRAERPEQGFSDTAEYVYADQNTAAPNDAYRRIVVTRTIQLRNARSSS